MLGTERRKRVLKTLQESTGCVYKARGYEPHKGTFLELFNLVKEKLYCTPLSWKMQRPAHPSLSYTWKSGCHPPEALAATIQEAEPSAGMSAKAGRAENGGREHSWEPRVATPAQRAALGRAARCLRKRRIANAPRGDGGNGDACCLVSRCEAVWTRGAFLL